MDIGTVIGVVLGLLLVIGSIIVGGGSGFLNVPAMLITIGGSFAATLMNYPLPKIMATISVIKKAFADNSHDILELFAKISDFALRARRDGILALEDDIESIEDEFMKKGFQMAVDGNAADVIKYVYLCLNIV